MIHINIDNEDWIEYWYWWLELDIILDGWDVLLFSDWCVDCFSLLFNPLSDGWIWISQCGVVNEWVCECVRGEVQSMCEEMKYLSAVSVEETIY